MMGQLDTNLPTTWTTSTLGAVARGFLSGGTPSTKIEAFWHGSIPWITSKWLNTHLYLDSGEKFISNDAVRQSATTIVPRNNLIFATRVGVGKVAVNQLDLAINQDLAGVLIDSDNYDLRFIAYQLRSERVQKVIASHKRGATIQGITRDNLKELEINLPPISEQRKIAGVLGVVQRTIEQQERLLALTVELKKALLHQIFTQGLRGEPLRQTDNSFVPESWEVVKLADLVQIKHGFAFNGEFFKPTGHYILLTPGHFFESGGFRDQGEKTKFYTGDFSRDYLLQKGDLLVAMTEQKEGLLGSSLFVPESDRYLHNQRLGLIQDLNEKRLSKDFLYYLFNTSAVRKRISMTASGSKVRHTSPGKIRDVEVALPSLEEQQESVKILKAVDQKLTVASRKRTALTNLFRTLLHQLMTAQIRVHDLDLSELAIPMQG
jgi:type I restriction enzyme, S subunit